MNVRTTLRCRTAIDAHRLIVWHTLLDVGQYPSWNPYYVEVAGEVAARRRLRMEVCMDATDARTTARPRVLEVSPLARIVWRSRFLMPGLLTATHVFELQRDGEGTMLEQSESFVGVLLPLSARVIRQVSDRLDALGVAVRERSEQIAASG